MAPRARSEGRFDELTLAAASLFSRQGYRRTQMADVAGELGVSPGTLYNYVAGKEALFDLCVQRAFVDEDPGPPPSLPVPTPARADVVEHVRQRLARMRHYPAMDAALARSDGFPDARSELRGVVREQYRFLRQNWRGLQLIERSAADRPELAELYFHKGRARLIERWAEFIQRRVDAGVFRPVPNAVVAARLVIETIAWSAWHRHGDPAPSEFDDDVACETIALFCRRALLVEERP